MKQELDELLCTKYPKMMVNRNKPMMETCMCWGFECGDGFAVEHQRLAGVYGIHQRIGGQGHMQEVTCPGQGTQSE